MTVLAHHNELAWAALVSHDVIVNLIGATKTASGLRVKARLDQRRYRWLNMLLRL
jgi:hypothetical protein